MACNPKNKTTTQATFILTIVSIIYYVILLCPTIYQKYGAIIVISGFILGIITLYNLIMCTFNDPGILLRGNLEKDPF